MVISELPNVVSPFAWHDHILGILHENVFLQVHTLPVLPSHNVVLRISSVIEIFGSQFGPELGLVVSLPQALPLGAIVVLKRDRVECHTVSIRPDVLKQLLLLAQNFVSVLKFVVHFHPLFGLASKMSGPLIFKNLIVPILQSLSLEPIVAGEILVEPDIFYNKSASVFDKFIPNLTWAV